MLSQVESKKYSIQGLTTQIEDVQQRINIANTDEDRAAALAELDQLNAKKAELKQSLDTLENRTRRSFEPELCYTCHKEQRAQFNLPTHHPVTEDRMKCTSCHNPHGGERGNLRGETINQTCYKCHAEMEGPYVFEHPPVSEDCTICHRPHGSAQNYLLRQSEPFLCLKCHAGPHSRSGTFTNGDDAATTSRVPIYYWQCTSCHNRPHGFDRHAAFHY
jgi:DmsE family decaheme c-type cytochrome